jgi:glycosyltransferase involved in cell wall biosynthesis
MKDVPAVSVVIPLFNKGPYIGRALRSVFKQTFQDLEVIVVDDGSSDDGGNVVTNFNDPRITLIRQENRGVSVARNRGIAAARAELIAFLDADDEWFPDHLETLIRLRNKFPRSGAYATAVLLKTEGSDYKMAPFAEIPKAPWEGVLPNYFRAAAMGNPPVSSTTVAIPRAVLTDMKGFSEEAWWGEDTDLWGRIALRYSIAFSWEGGGIYHIDAANRACNKIKPVPMNAFVVHAQKVLQAGEVPEGLHDDLLEYIAVKQIETADRNTEAGRPDLAREILRNVDTKHLGRRKRLSMLKTYIPRRVLLATRNWNQAKE